jgi:translocator protein
VRSSLAVQTALNATPPRVIDKRSFAALAICLAAAFLTAAFGAMFVPGAWYANLIKPDWNPPAWVFGPVWTILYLANAIAAWRVWRCGHSHVAVSAWFLQLVPNALWSYFCFGLHRLDWALIDIVLLDVAIVAVIALFYRHDRIAGWLMLPYFAWVSFAAFLNWTLFSLNLNL